MIESVLKQDLQYLKKMTVLFVEDDTFVAEQISSLLDIFFDRVLTAHTGEEAFELYQDQQPNIILSDLEMPQIGGIELFHMIRKKNQTIPIIVLSAHSDQTMLLKAANAQIDAYILKPIDLNVLLDTLHRVLPKITHQYNKFQFKNGLVYNPMTEELFNNNQSIPLGKKEKMLLKLFIENKNRVIEKDELLENIWICDDVSESALKNLINRVRTKIGFELIVSVKGSGWKLNTDL